MTNLTRSNVEDLFERRRDAWLKEDTESYLALWAEDMLIELPGRKEPIRGRDAYAEIVDKAFASLRPVSWEFHRLAVDGDHVLSEWTISGEVRASGKAATWRGMAICRIEDGLLKEWREYWDPASLRDLQV